MVQGVKSQLGGIGKGAGKQVLQEPLEILKDASGQLSGEAIGGVEDGRDLSLTQTEGPKPSLDEKKKPTTLVAHRTELEDMIKQKREVRRKAGAEQKLVEEKQQEQVENQQERAKKETFFQKVLKTVRKRSHGEIKPGMPKAA